MDKTYKYRNGTIHVELPESCDREKLKRITEDFLKKVLNGGKNIGNSNTSRNLNKE